MNVAEIADDERGQQAPSPASLHSLDALTFFLADVRDGLGPYLAIDPASIRHGNPSAIGNAMAAMPETADPSPDRAAEPATA